MILKKIMMLVVISCSVHGMLSAAVVQITKRAVDAMTNTELEKYIHNALAKKITIKPADVSGFKKRIAVLPNPATLLSVLVPPAQRKVAVVRPTPSAPPSPASVPVSPTRAVPAAARVRPTPPSPVTPRAAISPTARGGAGRVPTRVAPVSPAQIPARERTASGSGSRTSEGEVPASTTDALVRQRQEQKGAAVAQESLSGVAADVVVAQEQKRGEAGAVPASESPAEERKPAAALASEPGVAESKAATALAERRAQESKIATPEELAKKAELELAQALKTLEEELAREKSAVVSAQEQGASNTLLCNALASIAYAGIPSKVSADDSRYTFDNGAYETIMVRELNTLIRNPAFKKAAHLKQLLGIQGAEGPLLLFLHSRVMKGREQTQEHFVDQLSKNLATLNKELAAILNAGVFMPGCIEDVILDMIIVQYAVSQCSYPRAVDESTLTDGAALDVIRTWLASAAEDPALIAAKKGEQQPGESKRSAAAESKEEKQAAELGRGAIVLAKDYIPDLRKQLIFLCINQEFERPYCLIGSEFIEIAQKKNLQIAQIQQMPLLLKSSKGEPKLEGILVSDDPSLFDVQKFKGALKSQLFFDSTEFDNLLADPAAVPRMPEGAFIGSEKIEGSFVLKMILLNHKRLMQQVAGQVHEEGETLRSLVQEPLRTMKTLQDLKTLVDNLLKKINNPEIKAKEGVIQDLKKMLAAPVKDVGPESFSDAIAVLVSDIQGLASEALYKKIKDIVRAEIARKERYAQAIIVVEAIKRGDFGGKTADQYLLERLPAIVAAHDISRYTRIIQASNRMPKSIIDLFENIVGKKELSSLIRPQDWYARFAAYGLLIKLVTEAREELQRADTNQKLARIAQKIINSLQALHSGVIQRNLEYLPFIQNEETAVTLSNYKGRLGALVQALDNYDIEAFFNQIVELLNATGLSIDYSTELTEDAKKRFAQALYTLLRDGLKNLNDDVQGGLHIQGLAKDGKDKVRILRIYRYIIKKSLDPLLILLPETTTTLSSVTPESIEKAISLVRATIEKNSSEQADKVAFTKEEQANVDAFLRTLQEQIIRLVNVIHAESKEAAAEGGGIPAAPLMDEGGVPDAPPL